MKLLLITALLFSTSAFASLSFEEAITTTSTPFQVLKDAYSNPSSRAVTLNDVSWASQYTKEWEYCAAFDSNNNQHQTQIVMVKWIEKKLVSPGSPGNGPLLPPKDPQYSSRPLINVIYLGYAGDLKLDENIVDVSNVKYFPNKNGAYSIEQPIEGGIGTQGMKTDGKFLLFNEKLTVKGVLQKEMYGYCWKK